MNAKDEAADLDRITADIVSAAPDENEPYHAFLCALAEAMDCPCDAFVIGEPVSLMELDYEDTPRRGLTARVRREDGTEYSVAAADVSLAPHAKGAQVLAAYRAWLGIVLEPGPRDAPSGRVRRHRAVEEDIDLSRPVELVVLSVAERAARCRLLSTDRVINLRVGRMWRLFPGEIAVVKPHRFWQYGGPNLSGEIESIRLDVPALGLEPLKLSARDEWNPAEHYWGEEGEPIEDWAKPIIARGPRPMFEMEQILPGCDPKDMDSDPTYEAVELWQSGSREEATRKLMKMCEADLRCIDAHAHLASFRFDHMPEDAIRHYAVGVGIAELSFPPDFDAVLPWGCIDNRPYLRCLHGHGLCLWRLERFEEAVRVFDRLLWLNPSDNQGARFLIDDVRAHTPWKNRAEAQVRPAPRTGI
jgi:hypothetical protein